MLIFGAKKFVTICVMFFWVHLFTYVRQYCRSFREQWIRAKYERREFVEESTLSPLTPTSTKEGHMFKRGKDDKKFNKRKFTLNHSDGTLKYYVKDVCANCHL